MKAYEKKWKKRIEDDEKLAATRYELTEELFSIGDDNIQTKLSAGGLPLDIVERLGRWQGMIGRWCGKFRYIKMVYTWEESILSFSISACFLAGGIVSLFLPWTFILTWTARFVMYGFFGPHMKIVDIIRLNSDSEKPLRKAIEEFHEQSKFARARREEALKLKDLKKMFFGKYITLVPAFNLARHHDRPLPESFARICRKGATKVNVHKDSPWIPGQQLLGVMIPQPVHAEHNSKDEKVFDALLSRIEGLRRDGLARRLSNPSLDEGLPSAVGYELIIKEDDESHHVNDYDSGDHEDDDESSDKNESNGDKREDVLTKRLDISPSRSSIGDKVVVVDTCRYHLKKGKISAVDYSEQSIVMDTATDEMGIEIVDIGRFSVDLNEFDEMVCEQSVFGSGSSIQSNSTVGDDSTILSDSIQHKLMLDGVVRV